MFTLLFIFRNKEIIADTKYSDNSVSQTYKQSEKYKQTNTDYSQRKQDVNINKNEEINKHKPVFTKHDRKSPQQQRHPLQNKQTAPKKSGIVVLFCFVFIFVVFLFVFCCYCCCCYCCCYYCCCCCCLQILFQIDQVSALESPESDWKLVSRKKHKHYQDQETNKPPPPQQQQQQIPVSFKINTNKWKLQGVKI